LSQIFISGSVWPIFTKFSSYCRYLSQIKDLAFFFSDIGLFTIIRLPGIR